jgi:hypothetical protein
MTRIISIVGGLQPTAPTIGTATAGDTTASVAFTASSYIGKGTITYTATSSPGGLTATGASSPLTVTGLSNGTAYTFTVVGNTNYGVASLASASSNSITPAAAGSFVTIASTTLSSSANSVTFSGIPNTYQHLELHGYARTTQAVSASDIAIYFNSLGGTYYKHWGYGFNGDSTIYPSFGSAGSASIGYLPGTTVGTNYVASTVISIQNYAGTNKLKLARYFTGQGFDGSSGNTIAVRGSLHWDSTAAINSITLSCTGIATGSTFTLYGITGS